MRRLRDALRSSGFARSAGVIELMMPSMRAILRSSTFVPCAARASSAGSLSIIAGEAAHLAHLRDLRLEVVEVEALAGLDLPARASAPPRRRRSCAPPRSATARRPCRGCATPCARDGTTSSPSIFSETPTNLIGAPVTWRTDSAAPPRASPSSLVRMTPVSGSASRNAARRVDRVLALHRVDDEQRLDRLHRRVQLARSRASSPRRSRAGRRCRRSARRGSACAPSRARAAAIATGCSPTADGKKSTPTCAASVCELLDRRRAGRRRPRRAAPSSSARAAGARASPRSSSCPRPAVPRAG